MYQNILYSILRAIFAYSLLLVVARLMGRKALSQMTFFDFAVIITLGSVTANLAIPPVCQKGSMSSMKLRDKKTKVPPEKADAIKLKINVFIF